MASAWQHFQQARGALHMFNTFQLVGLPQGPFEPLFALSDEQLLMQHGAVRVLADQSPGFPCRISLQDAAVGEELLLLPYEHQHGASPYRASGPIFVRRGASQTRLAAGDVSSYITGRLISVRAYNAAHWMVDAAVCEGPDVVQHIERCFENDAVTYIHLHNAKRGCFSCEVQRA